jgi:hypothetical protein
MLGLRRLAYRYVARGLADGEGCVVVTTDRSAADVAERLREAGVAATDRVGVVDATGQAPTADLPVETVGSPADLTGIGIGVSKLLEQLHDAGVDGYRVLLDSLSTLLVYAEFERVYQFVHTLTGRIGDVDGRSLTLLSSDTDGGALGRLQGLFDGVLELREGDDGAEYRVRGGAADGDAGWQPIALEPAAPDGAAPEATPAGRADPELLAALESVASVGEMIEAVSAAGHTLSVLNHTGGPLEEVSAALSRFNVDVRTVELPTDTPADAAVLHCGGEVVACCPVAELQDAVRLDGEGGVRPDVLEQAARDEYTVEDGGKLRMVRISRLVERRALETGTGTLHAAFQRLDRLADELDTRALYESIADTDVTVHLYGAEGEVPESERYVLHRRDTPELSDAWFVVYDGGDRPDRAAALVSEETAPGRYSGFWTYQPALVAAVEDYLSSRYLA